MLRAPLLIAALCLSLGACAESLPSLQGGAAQGIATATVPVGVPDAAPASFLDTCARSPENCGATAAGARLQTAALDMNADAIRGADSHATAAVGAPEGAARPADIDDDQALKLLQAVNSEVNGQMARNRSLLVNPEDDWAPAKRTSVGLVGDCKSFAAEKRQRLLADGFPADRLFYAVVFREGLGLHALLMVRLNRGDYALDSRQPWVTPWYQAPYVYVQRQTPGDPMRWTNLVAPQAAVAPILLANDPKAAAVSGAGLR